MRDFSSYIHRRRSNDQYRDQHPPSLKQIQDRLRSGQRTPFPPPEPQQYRRKITPNLIRDSRDLRERHLMMGSIGVLKHALLAPISKHPHLRLIRTRDLEPEREQPLQSVAHTERGFSRDANCLYWCGNPILRLVASHSRPVIELTGDLVKQTETLTIHYDDLNHFQAKVRFPHSVIVAQMTVDGRVTRIKPHRVGHTGLCEAIQFFYDTFAEKRRQDRVEEQKSPPAELAAHLKSLLEMSRRDLVITTRSTFGLEALDLEAKGDLAVIGSKAGHYFIRNTSADRLIVLCHGDAKQRDLIFPGHTALLEDGQLVILGMHPKTREPALRPFRFREPKPMFTPMEIYRLENWEMSAIDWEPIRVTDNLWTITQKAKQLFAHARRAANCYSYHSHAVIPIIPVIIPPHSQAEHQNIGTWLHTILKPVLVDLWLRNDGHFRPYQVVLIDADREVEFYDRLTNHPLELNLYQLFR